jgi:hypothetical protein
MKERRVKCEEKTGSMEVEARWRWPIHRPGSMFYTSRMQSAHKDRKTSVKMAQNNKTKTLSASTGRTGSNDVEAGRSPSVMIQ